LLITKAWPPKTNPNKPKNKAEKSFRKASVEKTKPKANPAMLLKINGG
jgi:hypothetical protein